LSNTYKHIFFDLDHTLWDHQRNADETLSELFVLFEMEKLGTFTVDQFSQVFHKINHELWHHYHLGAVDQTFIREQRFKRVLSDLKVEEFKYWEDLGREYLFRCPRKSNLMPYTIEVLDYLKPRYPMTIITNGFDEIQDVKMNHSGIQGYFQRVITSELAGWLKPHRGIFDFALKQSGVAAGETIMIGDNPVTDISGARDAGIDQVYYNSRDTEHATDSTYTIGDLQELKRVL